MSALEMLLEGFEWEIEAAIRDRNKPRGGQQVPFNGDFAGSSVSALLRMRWWLREFRSAAGIPAGPTEGRPRP